MSPLIPGSIVANIHTRPGLVPSGRHLQSLRQAELLRRRLPHVRFAEPLGKQASARPREYQKVDNSTKLTAARRSKPANGLVATLIDR